MKGNWTTSLNWAEEDSLTYLMLSPLPTPIPAILCFFVQEFESMFHLRPVAAENEDFLYRAYPKDWTVARKPKLGPPKVRSGHNQLLAPFPRYQSPIEFTIAAH